MEEHIKKRQVTCALCGVKTIHPIKHGNQCHGGKRWLNEKRN